MAGPLSPHQTVCTITVRVLRVKALATSKELCDLRQGSQGSQERVIE